MKIHFKFKNKVVINIDEVMFIAVYDETKKIVVIFKNNKELEIYYKESEADLFENDVERLNSYFY